MGLGDIPNQTKGVKRPSGAPCRRVIPPHQAHSIATASPDPDRLATSAETGRQIASALESLGPVERAAFTLRHFEGYSLEEIARTLSLRNNNVKQHQEGKR